jgi:RNA polymerase sigma factor (sigma-70 family)
MTILNSLGMLGSIVSEDVINYEAVNLANLNIYSLLRQELWAKVLETPKLHDCKIEVLDSMCPCCKKFIDSDDKSCRYCKVVFTTKPVKTFKKVTAPGKGRKHCPGCELYVAVRTFTCDCGWDFKAKKQTDNKKIASSNAVQNIKKKKAEEYSIKEILNLELLVKNDRIRSNYLKIKKFIEQTLNREEFLEIWTICSALITKRNQILKFNYKLVLEYVNKFYPKSGCKHLKKEDLISTGNLGLINAIDHFDETRKVNPEKNEGKDKHVSFSTYAHFWIKKEIIDEINTKEKDIRIPEHIINVYRTFLNYYNKFKVNNEREPSLEEIMQANNVKEKKAAGLLFAKEYRSAGGISIDEVNRYSDSEIESKKTTGYTNLKFNNGSLDTFRLTDSIQEENFEISKLDWDKIKFRNEKYKKVFFALKGINGFPEMTIDEISKHFVISKLTITKIGKETIEKIRDLLKISLVEVEAQEK